MSNRQIQITIGCDPEFFLFDSNKGVNISAHDIVPGNKLNPYRLRKGAVQADGTAVEFNIDPARTPEEFANNIETVLYQIRDMIPGHLKFQFTPTVYYEPAYFDGLPENSKELGCDPDWDALSAAIRPRPNIGRSTMRTGAGHIHIGWTHDENPVDRSHLWDCCHLVGRLDDYFFLYRRIWDRDRERQILYGEPGCFRPKSYGVEYRVLSNAWLNYPELWPWIFNSARWVMEDSLHRQGSAWLCSEHYSYFTAIRQTNTTVFKAPFTFPQHLTQRTM